MITIVGRVTCASSPNCSIIIAHVSINSNTIKPNITCSHILCWEEDGVCSTSNPERLNLYISSLVHSLVGDTQKSCIPSVVGH